MFTRSFGKYACTGDTISCEVGKFRAIAQIKYDDCRDAPDERSDGFWPSHDPKAAGYVLPEDYDTETAKAEAVMKAWNDNEWFYCGSVVTIYWRDIELSSASLWGIECNYPHSDNAYLLECANDLLIEALDEARATAQEMREELEN